MKKKILIIYEKSKNVGMGHYYRSYRLKSLLKKKYDVNHISIEHSKFFEKSLNKFDLVILDLKNYPKIKNNKKIIIFEDINKTNKNILSINPLDIFLKNSGPEFFLFPKNLNKVIYNFDKKTKINILFIQGANDSNNQLHDILKYVIKNKNKVKFEFRIISKKFKSMKQNDLDCKFLNFYKDASKIYNGIQIAISSVGNTAFELGKIGIPTIHYTVEPREIKRALILEKLKLGKFIKKNCKHHIIKELNKIYLDNNYRKKLIKNRINYFNKKNELLKLIKNEI